MWFGLDEFVMVVLEVEVLCQVCVVFEICLYDIVCFVVEFIQGEGGDCYFCLEFFVVMCELCDEFDVLLIFDEVQIGCGLIGIVWVYQQLDVVFDIVVFGKKMQVCGVMVGWWVDEVVDNVFVVLLWFNLIWGGNFIDMVCVCCILEVIEVEGLFEWVVQYGKYLCVWFDEFVVDFLVVVFDLCGCGLMCVFSLLIIVDCDELICQLW